MNEDLIIVDRGEVFNGTRQQFRENFFDNATDQMIEDWCEREGYSLEIKHIRVDSSMVEQ